MSNYLVEDEKQTDLLQMKKSVKAELKAERKMERDDLKREIEQEKMSRAFKNKNAYETSSCWSWLLFTWTAPILDYSKKNQLKIEELGSIRKGMDVKH